MPKLGTGRTGGTVCVLTVPVFSDSCSAADGLNGVKNTAWDALRVEWGNWKFIAEERQRYPDTASFWCAFSDGNGKRFSYQQILNCIADRRISAAARDANDARTFFGGDLDNPLAEGAFRYNKGGKSYLSSKDDAVAKKWRELLATRHDQTSRVVLVEFCQLRNHPPSERPHFFFLFFFALHT
ncbi:hypothetical protein P692DRAFT_20756062 [Suillus brevipes Sb2]|nr:hypothetical protein P692DRAFT_20756062 [Suillus brevipes Sb2]